MKLFVTISRFKLTKTEIFHLFKGKTSHIKSKMRVHTSYLLKLHKFEKEIDDVLYMI